MRAPSLLKLHRSRHVTASFLARRAGPAVSKDFMKPCCVVNLRGSFQVDCLHATGLSERGQYIVNVVGRKSLPRSATEAHGRQHQFGMRRPLAEKHSASLNDAGASSDMECFVQDFVLFKRLEQFFILQALFDFASSSDLLHLSAASAFSVVWPVNNNMSGTVCRQLHTSFLDLSIVVAEVSMLCTIRIQHELKLECGECWPSAHW